MTTKPHTARDAIFGMLNTAWATKTTSIVGYVPEIRWQGYETGEPPANDKFWIRAGTYLVDTNQSSYAMAEHTVSGVRYTTDGLFIAQVFAPMSPAAAQNSYRKGELLAELIQCIYMSAETNNGVWFRRPQIETLDNDGTRYRWNVNVQFTFDQSKGHN